MSTVQRAQGAVWKSTTKDNYRNRLWKLVHIDMKVQYTKSTRQRKSGGALIQMDVSLAFMKILDPEMSWFEIFEVP